MYFKQILGGDFPVTEKHVLTERVFILQITEFGPFHGFLGIERMFHYPSDNQRGHQQLSRHSQVKNKVVTTVEMDGEILPSTAHAIDSLATLFCSKRYISG